MTMATTTIIVELLSSFFSGSDFPEFVIVVVGGFGSVPPTGGFGAGGAGVDEAPVTAFEIANLPAFRR